MDRVQLESTTTHVGGPLQVSALLAQVALLEITTVGVLGPPLVPVRRVGHALLGNT